MKRIALTLLLAGLFAPLAAAQQGQTPPPPLVYEDIAFPELPYPSNFVTLEPEGLPAASMHYMEGGDPAAAPILFLHGNPTWSYLWRDIMPHLEDRARVIAIDLIGMGMSDKPEIGYFFREHALYLDAFIDALDLNDLTLVIQDWGSGLGLDYATRNPERVRAIALFEAMLPPAQPLVLEELSDESRQFLGALRTPGLGEGIALGQNVFVEQFMNSPAGTHFGLSEDELNAYRAPFPTPESRIAVWRWPNEIPISGSPADTFERITAAHAWLAQTDTPILYLHGNEGGLHRAGTIPWLEANVANVATSWIGPAGHFAQEDQPHAIGAAIAVWYQLLD